MATTPTQAITLVTIDLADLVNELEWMQDTEPMAFDAESVLARADRLRQLQAEQNALIAEVLGLVMRAGDSEP